MNSGSRRFCSLLTISLAILLLSVHYSPPVRGNVTTPNIGIWSEAYASSAIVDPTILPNSIITVDINVTNAPAFNGFDLTLFYDQVYLQPVFIDVRGGAFANPFIGAEDATGGSIRLAVVDVGGDFAGGSNTLARISFNVTGIGVSPLTFAAPTTHPSIWSQSSTQLVLGYSEIQVTTLDGYFTNVAGNNGPAASFTFSPVSPIEGDTVVFDASSSFDPANNHGVNSGISEYIWDFGDGYSDITPYPADTHRFAYIFLANAVDNFYGNFSVRLTVVGSGQQFEGMITQRVEIRQMSPPSTNFRLDTNSIPRSVTPGLSMTYAITLTSVGGFTGPVVLRAKVVPSVPYGPTTSFAKKINQVRSQITVVLTVRTSSSTPPGYYNIVVSATRAQLSQNAIVYLTVYPSG